MPRTRGGHDQTELVRLAISGIDAQIRELEEKRRVLSRLISAGPGRPRAATVRKSQRRGGKTRADSPAAAKARSAAKRVGHAPALKSETTQGGRQPTSLLPKYQAPV